MMHSIDVYAKGGQAELESIAKGFANDVAEPAGVIDPRRPWELKEGNEWPIRATFYHGWAEIGKNRLIEKIENILSVTSDYRIEYHMCYHDDPDKDIPCVVEQDDIYTP